MTDPSVKGDEVAAAFLGSSESGIPHTKHDLDDLSSSAEDQEDTEIIPGASKPKSGNWDDRETRLLLAARVELAPMVTGLNKKKVWPKVYDLLREKDPTWTRSALQCQQKFKNLTNHFRVFLEQLDVPPHHYEPVPVKQHRFAYGKEMLEMTRLAPHAFSNTLVTLASRIASRCADPPSTPALLSTFTNASFASPMALPFTVAHVAHSRPESPPSPPFHVTHTEHTAGGERGKKRTLGDALSLEADDEEQHALKVLHTALREHQAIVHEMLSEQHNAIQQLIQQQNSIYQLLIRVLGQLPASSSLSH